MMRKRHLALALALLACFSLIISGCLSTPPEAKVTRPINELWEPVYRPDFAFEPYRTGGSAGYTVGLVELDFAFESVPQDAWEMTARERMYHEEFIDAFAEGLKEIFTAKGMAVRGPFPTYDDIGFVERSKCDFVLRPKLVLELEPTQLTLIEELSDYGGPHGEPLVYGASSNRLDARARLEYVVIDPRTRKRLHSHSLRTRTITKGYEQLWSRWTMTYGNNSRAGWRTLEHRPRKYPNYHNADNATAKALEDVYHDLMPRLNKVISSRELALLKK